MPELTVRPVIEFPVEAILTLWNSAFANYVTGPVRLAVPNIADFMAGGNVNQNLSLVACADGKPAGVGMIARQGWSSRLAVMGVATAYQGQGVGKYLLGQLLDASQKRSDKRFVLECFEQNERAARLYEQTGFRIMHRLMGYRATDLVGEVDPALEEIDPVEMAAVVSQDAPADTPWQLSGAQIARSGPPSRAFRLGHAYAAIGDPHGATIRVLGFFVPPAHQRQGAGSRLLRALTGRYPHTNWFMPQIWPEPYGGFWLKHGFVQEKLNQLQMVYTFPTATP
jgi:ribosomal protein S18 acetylase RimI-like enzyme